MADRAEQPELDTTAPAPPSWLHDADQVEQKYEEAAAAAVEACADDTKSVLGATGAWPKYNFAVTTASAGSARDAEGRQYFRGAGGRPRYA